MKKTKTDFRDDDRKVAIYARKSRITHKDNSQYYEELIQKRLDELIISDESEREYREAQKQAERINKDIAAQKKYA